MEQFDQMAITSLPLKMVNGALYDVSGINWWNYKVRDPNNEQRRLFLVSLYMCAERQATLLEGDLSGRDRERVLSYAQQTARKIQEVLAGNITGPCSHIYCYGMKQFDATCCRDTSCFYHGFYAKGPEPTSDERDRMSAALQKLLPFIKIV
ncbi:MAG: hypothetical protein PHO20_05000 [Candidatus Peribacteraceae bacterium]|nr:hypothetical protein [Candidatus Peribacteraceae bacterium]MDD5740094.1 hypothetical protein [Candidatus Peribacteraceae bacterium]